MTFKETSNLSSWSNVCLSALTLLLFKKLIWSDWYISCLKNILGGTDGTDFN